MLQNLTEFKEFDWSYIFLQKKHDFGVYPRNAEHRDLKLAPDGARTTIPPWLRLHKQCIW